MSDCVGCEGTGTAEDQNEIAQHTRNDAIKLFKLIVKEQNVTEIRINSVCEGVLSKERVDAALETLIEAGYIQFEQRPSGRRFTLTPDAPTVDYIFTWGHHELMSMRRATIAKMLAGEDPYGKVLVDGFIEYRNMASHLHTSGKIAAYLKQAG